MTTLPTRRVAPLLLLLATACAHGAAGRVRPVEPIVTDRPDFTESPSIVPAGMAQIENGYSATREGDVRTSTIGEVLVRAAVTERAELRLAFNSYAMATTSAGRERGFEDPSVGMKVKLVTPAESSPALLPDLSLLASTTVPSRRGPFRESTFQPEAKLAASWELPAGMSFSSNVGYASATDSQRRFAELSASTSLGFEVSSRVGAFAEYYGFTAGRGAGFANYFDGGVTYLITPNLQLDARGGVGANGTSPDRIWGVGLSTRW